CTFFQNARLPCQRNCRWPCSKTDGFFGAACAERAPLYAGWGAGELVVVEADESDRSLLKLHPDIAVLTNAELDHHSEYGSRLEVDETFRAFLARASGGVVVWERPELVALAPPTSDVTVVPYDVPEPILDPSGAQFGWRGHDVRLAVPGAHNALNAAAALEACRLAGADPASAAAALADFRGAGRRFELLGTSAGGARIYTDYAHHPTEVAAALAAARTLAPGRVVVVFQPHLYSRTRALAREFGAALAAADLVVLLDVYPARELAADFPGVSGRLVAQAAVDARRDGPVAGVAWLPGFDAAERYLQAQLRPGDLCLAMGAGDVDQFGRGLVA
ncbi:MAG TPA: cyanophycin synthetase, partial [Conexibacter sp.]|nr:cyanophycin synthetase [Conexibacter sp.]